MPGARGYIRRPPVPLLNRGSAQRRGLVAWWPLIGGRLSNVLSSTSASAGGSLGYGTALDGHVIPVGDGFSTYVDLGDLDLFDFGANDYTLTCWLRIDATVSARRQVFSKDSASGRQFTLEINDTGLNSGSIGHAQ